MEKIIDLFSEDAQKFTFENEYHRLTRNINNISYWFPKIRKCGIKTPYTEIITVPMNIVKAFYMEDNTIQGEINIKNWVDKEVTPAVKRLASNTYSCSVFIKNGTFSNKFNASCCLINIYTPYLSEILSKKIFDINYTSLLYGADGNSELAIRSVIPFEESEVPTIYNGLPLRNEYRVFYDFDNHKVLYTSNYWDYDYCNSAIARNATDKIIYEHEYPKLLLHYENNYKKVEQLVFDAMKNNNELSGKWSIDILETIQPNGASEFYLIDMATAEQSAYWNNNSII